MAHDSSVGASDLCRFERVDLGSPKTTNLDEALAANEGVKSAADPGDHSNKVEGEPTRELSKLEEILKTQTELMMENDDVVTVKYFPLNASSGAPPDDTEQTSSEHQMEYFESRDDSADARARVVEHVRKNLHLYETNREVYDTSGPAYANRGHLQSILTRRQNHPPLSTLNSRYSDQYTQYRASDLVNNSQNRQTTEPNPITYIRSNQKSKRLTLKSSPDQEELDQAAGERKSNSLKRGVSSLNELLKKPIEFVKLHSGYQRTSNQGVDNQESRENQPINEEEIAGEEQYKVPVKLSFTTSSSLYLLPVPDYTVQIATRLVKDIILAHQRARHKEATRKALKTRTGNKLAHLLKTYSFRRSELESIAQQHQATAGNSNNSSLTRRFKLATSGNTLAKRIREPTQEPTLDHSVNKIRAKVKMPSGRSEKALIIDNKDGTIKIAYEPKEVGAHEITLRYNDEPIDECPIFFYVDTVGSAKKKITAYGQGLMRGLVGEKNSFTINTGGLGSAKLNVTVEGASKTQVDLVDNKDGTITVSYVPLIPGEYKVKVSFDGKQVIGSPFTTLIGDEGRQRSQLSVGRGNEHTLDLKISEEDLKTLDAIIVTPCGLSEPCGLKLLKSGQLAIIYTPREQGDHVVNVRRRGNHISGSPFKFDVLSRDIGDAKQVKVSGKGLKEGSANSENEIIINTKDSGYGGLSVAFEGPGRSEIVQKEVTDGTVKLSYTPYEPGQYSLIVKYADHVVPGSPFGIKVTGQGTNPQKASLKKFRKLVSLAEVNTECHFSFKIPGTSAYDLSARIHSPQGNSDDASVKDKGDFVYQVSFVPKETGLYALSIRNKDIHIPGSPFPFTVGTLDSSGPHKVRCGGPGLIKGPINKLNEFDIFTREAGAGELTVIMEGPSKPELFYTDRKDGSCHIGYKVAQAGEYRVSVLFENQEVPESPFRTIIMPNTGDISKVELGPMPPENMIQLNKPYNLPIIMNGAKGNIEAKVKLPSGKLEDCFASPIDAENWGVRFIPREFGIYQVHIKCKGTHIPQSPVFVRVGHDNADPAAILVHGHGLKGAVVNHATDFTIETCNAGHSMLEVNIEGPSKVSMGCAELDEGYKINYTPLAPGDYLISIKYNGCHIGSSPFKVRATKQPGSKTIADAGSHEISTIAISTTDREAKQKVDHMPKFKSDATRVYCKGMGLKKAFAGKPNTFTVNCSEAGFNMMYASFLGPSRNTIHECSVKHMGGQIYEVKYTCKDRGDAMLIVKYGDEQIPGSPFKLECV